MDNKVPPRVAIKIIIIKAMGRKQFVGHFEAFKCPKFAAAPSIALV